MGTHLTLDPHAHRVPSSEKWGGLEKEPICNHLANMLYDYKPKDDRQDIIKAATNGMTFALCVLQAHESQRPPQMLPAILS